jgi:hypothetical protein
MNINGINNASPAGYKVAQDNGKVHHEGTNGQAKEEDKVKAEASPSSGTTASLANNTAMGENETKGVINLLQQGHFQGVADVRLRINFNDEITAMEQARKVQVAQEQTSTLTDVINSAIDSFLQTGQADGAAAEAITMALETFNEGMIQAVNGFAEENGSGETEMTSQIQLAFVDLTASLESIAIASTEPEGETPVVESSELNPDLPAVSKNAVTQPTIPMSTETISNDELSSKITDQLLAGLTEIFTTGMQELETALSEIQTLPDISEPRGNGAAFEKFMAIYNQMRGITEAPEKPTAVEAMT